MKRTVNIFNMKRTLIASLLALTMGMAFAAPSNATTSANPVDRIVAPTFDGKSGTETHGRGKDGNETHGRGKEGNETHGRAKDGCETHD